VADQRAFSPNGDGVKDTIVITPQPQVKEGIESWRMEVLDASGAVVRAFEGTGIPAAQTWNGRDARGSAVKDGAYSARAEVRYTLGNRPVASSTPFVVDTVAPAIELAVPAVAFSPNGDGSLDELRVSGPPPAGDDEWTPRSSPPTPRGRAAGPRLDLERRRRGLLLERRGRCRQRRPRRPLRLGRRSPGRRGNYRRAAAEGIVVDTVAPAIELAAPAPAFSPQRRRPPGHLGHRPEDRRRRRLEGAVVAADNSVSVPGPGRARPRTSSGTARTPPGPPRPTGPTAM
jgi:hypothetical protein